MHCNNDKSIVKRISGIYINQSLYELNESIQAMIPCSLYNLQITHMEMIKGIQGHGYYDELVIPIIENTAHERELTESLAEAVRNFAPLVHVASYTSDLHMSFWLSFLYTPGRVQLSGNCMKHTFH